MTVQLVHLVPFDANARSIVHHLQSPGRSKLLNRSCLYLEAAMTYPLDCHEDLHENAELGSIDLRSKSGGYRAV